MKKIKIILIILLLLIINSGCISKNEANELNNPVSKIELDDISFKNTIKSTKNRDLLPNASSGGVNTGLYNKNGEIEKEFHFYINKNENINKFISIGNMINKERVYKVILFVDYKQEKFSVDGRAFKDDFTFLLKAGQSIELPVAISSLDTGLHDILFVIAKYPDNKSLDTNFRKSTDMNNLLFVRFSAIVEKELPRKINYNKYGTTENKNILDGLFISNNNSFKRWLHQDVRIGKSFKYNIFVGSNGNINEKKYALLMIYDWNQINIRGNDDVLFFKVKSGSIINISSSLNVKNKKGVFDLCPILIDNPFEKCTINNKAVQTAIRVGINVT